MPSEAPLTPSGATRAVIVRSALFNAAFYVTTAFFLIFTLPLYLILPQWFAVGVIRAWGATEVWLLRVIAGTSVEVRGRENLPRGAALIACKHQSAFETVALFPLM